MKEWAKEILRQYYIGAIIVAMLTAEALMSVVRAIMFPIPIVAQNWGQSRMSEVDFRQYRFLVSQTAAFFLSAVLLLLVAYFLARWLYGAPPKSESRMDDSIEPDQPHRGGTAQPTT